MVLWYEKFWYIDVYCILYWIFEWVCLVKDMLEVLYLFCMINIFWYKYVLFKVLEYLIRKMKKYKYLYFEMFIFIKIKFMV